MKKNFKENAEPPVKVAVILPAYNEALTIKKTLEDFHATLPHAELYVIDNNSTDDSGTIAQQALVALGAVGNVFFEPWQGKGNAVRRAFCEIEADVYIMADADDTYPADQCFALMEPILRGEADMVVGDRISGGDYDRENSRPFHDVGNHLVVSLVNFVGKWKFNDVMSGYRAMSRAFVCNYPLTVPGFQLETDLSLFAAIHRYRIKEVPVRYKNRPEGSVSKLNTYRDGVRVLLTVLNSLRHYRPLVFFTWLASICALLSLCIGIPAMHAHTGGTFPPSLALACILGLGALVCLGSGLILDSLAFFHRNIAFIQHTKLERERERERERESSET